jgi:hypothetical protein
MTINALLRPLVQTFMVIVRVLRGRVTVRSTTEMLLSDR